MKMKIGHEIVRNTPLLWCSIIFASSLMQLCHGYMYEKETLDRFDDGQSYEKFIRKLREKVPKSGEKFGIPMLYKTRDLRDEQRFVLAELKSRGHVVTCVVHTPDLYVPGFVLNNKYYHFKDASVFPTDDFTKDLMRVKLPVEGSYDKLEESASSFGNVNNRNRRTIKIGLSKLNYAVANLAKYPAGGDGDKNAKHCEYWLTIIQMVSDAMKYNHFVKKFKDPYFSSPASPSMWSFENNWQKLSTQIIMADNNGVFKEPINLQGDDSKALMVKAVTDRDLKGKLALLKNM